ncbi:AAA family ATPase [Corynebacterium heidelbergense]|uniref:AAA family ATPase n=1 Tax=Corynebacterium heidelbergense TaxID=2055947 RepID=A0A364V5K1_9CORY|nr:AAA family ATPase [Corynebacterium heidelbergense]
MRARRGDTTTIEVKRAAGGLPHMSETLCALANMPNGGTIILGVDEANGRFDVVGVEDAASMESGLASMARQSVRPTPHLEFQTFYVDSKHVIVVHVSPLRLAEKPACCGGRAYLRQADGDYAMHPHELRMIEIAKLHADEQVGYDLAPAQGRSYNDLDSNLLEVYLEAVRAHDRRLRLRSDEQILQMTNVLASSGEPTLAGLYALGDYPQGQYPALTVTAAVQLPGGEGQARNRNLRDFTGPLPDLLDGLLDWVRQNLDTVNRYRPDGHMESVQELPLSAIRELLANALVHRDLGPDTLGIGKQVQVRLTRRNLFIQSPGGLRGVSLAQLEGLEHAQAAVNQRLYQIAKRLRTSDGASIIEGEGGGIQEVFRSAQERGLPRPQLIDTGVQFKALLWRPHDEAIPSSASTSTQRPPSETNQSAAPLPHSSAPTRHEPRLIEAFAQAGHPLDIHELCSRTGLTIGQVRYALSRPIDEGLIIMEGRQGARNTHYRLT